MSIFPYPLMLMSCINTVPLSGVRNYRWCATTYLPRRHTGKESPAEAEVQKLPSQSLGWEDPLEKEMATHSSILAWEILQSEEPDRLQPKGSQKSQT